MWEHCGGLTALALFGHLNKIVPFRSTVRGVRGGYGSEGFSCSGEKLIPGSCILKSSVLFLAFKSRRTNLAEGGVLEKSSFPCKTIPARNCAPSQRAAFASSRYSDEIRSSA